MGTAPVVETLALPAGALRTPRALAFNPAKRGELWVADSTLSGLARVTLNASGLAGATTAVEGFFMTKDRAEYHYLDSVSSIAFDPIGQFATCQESVNEYKELMPANFFMGPTMYDTRARGWVNSKEQSCETDDTCFLIHVDMLHESPLCMGLVHDNSAEWTAPCGAPPCATYRNVYWALGGGHSQLVRFDFESDHGPGSMDHSYASVRRYTGFKFSRVPGVPSQLALDEQAHQLYVADTGADRVMLMHTDSGRFTRDAKTNSSGGTDGAYSVYSSPLGRFNYSVWDGMQYSTFASVLRPSGIAISATTVYVGSYAEGSIHAFSRVNGELHQVLTVAPPNSLMGLTLEKTDAADEGVLYFVANGTVGRVQPVALHATACPAAAMTTPADGCADGVQNNEETGVDCGGRLCMRCPEGQGCASAADCATSNCTAAGVCGVTDRHYHTAAMLLNYLDSPHYRNSFLHHAIHQDSMSTHASYANPYPVMAADFCATVGGADAATGVLPDCRVIDFDSLLLGGCFCHYCLQPLNPCQNGGTCNNFNRRGYNCSCPAGYEGDHCQFASGSPHQTRFSGSFPWGARPPAISMASASPPPPPPSPPRYEAVGFSLLASGDVSEYTPDALAQVEAAVAVAAGVSANQVSASVTSGSVNLAVTIVVLADESSTVVSTMASQLANASAATDLLASVSAVAITVSAITQAPLAQSYGSPPSGPTVLYESQESDAWLIALLASLGVVVLLITAIISFHVFRGRKTASRTVTDVVKKGEPAATAAATSSTSSAVPSLSDSPPRATKTVV